MAKKELNRKEYNQGKSDRMEENRIFESREFEQRPAFNMFYQDPMHFDKSEIPDGVEYYWIRHSCLNEPDIGSQVDSKRKGWTPVPASRHPERVFSDFFGRTTHMRDYIEYKGSVLCERPKYLCEEERRMYEKINYDKIVSMPGTENFLGEPTMPGVNRSQTAIGRARVY